MTNCNGKLAALLIVYKRSDLRTAMLVSGIKSSWCSIKQNFSENKQAARSTRNCLCRLSALFGRKSSATDSWIKTIAQELAEWQSLRLTSSFSKVSVFKSPHSCDMYAFSNISMRFRWIRLTYASVLVCVDGRPKRIEMYPFSNENTLVFGKNNLLIC